MVIGYCRGVVVHTFGAVVGTGGALVHGQGFPVCPGALGVLTPLLQVQ